MLTDVRLASTMWPADDLQDRRPVMLISPRTPRFPLFWLPLLLLAALPGQGANDAGDVASPPPGVTTLDDAAGKLVNEWFAAGKAAGLEGIYYDNRCRGHSRLDLSKFPGLKEVSYTDEEKKKDLHAGLARVIRPEPTLGNASLSAPPEGGGSLGRMYYTNPQGLAFLNQQYASNQLYVYPEHKDHDPGLNGRPGYGDLFPTNTPCILISQGSSFSDRPFLEAFALTVAAFRPEVKNLLIQRNLLAPTLQSILRSSYQPVQTREHYLSGIAHPTAFDPKKIDRLRMVRRAQEMTPETIPPVLQLELITEEDPARPGIDFFEPAPLTSESLIDRGAVIARVFRGKSQSRQLTVAASRAVDLGNRPVRCEWRLLRGDPRLVTITPSPNTREALITVEHHPDPLPAPGPAGLISHRIDIGVFPDNGVTLGPPSFVTFYMLPNEHRVYDAKGRILEIDYRTLAHETATPTSNDLRWTVFLESIWDGGSLAWPGRLLWKGLTPEERSAIQQLKTELGPLIAAYRKLDQENRQRDQMLRDQHQEAVGALHEARKAGNPAAISTAEAELEGFKTREKAIRVLFNEIKRELEAMRGTFSETLRKTTVGDRSVYQVMQDAIERLVSAPDLYEENQLMLEIWLDKPENQASVPRFQSAKEHLTQVKFLSPDGEVLPPNPHVASLPGITRHQFPARTLYRRALQRLVVAEAVLPGLIEAPFSFDFVDPRMTVPKPWRDVFDYDQDSGELRGWSRYYQGGIQKYDALGRMFTPTGLAEVEYRIDPATRLLQPVPKSS